MITPFWSNLRLLGKWCLPISCIYTPHAPLFILYPCPYATFPLSYLSLDVIRRLSLSSFRHMWPEAMPATGKGWLACWFSCFLLVSGISKVGTAWSFGTTVWGNACCLGVCSEFMVVHSYKILDTYWFPVVKFGSHLDDALKNAHALTIQLGNAYVLLTHSHRKHVPEMQYKN